MSRTLVDLLDVKERDFRAYIDRLEHVSLRPGVDIRLTTELNVKAKMKLAELGVQGEDMNEVRAALQEKLARDDTKLLSKLRLTHDSTTNKVARHLSITATRLSESEQSIALTPAGLKRVLKAVPPTKTLKTLGLRSLASVLKRYDPRVLYIIALHVESSSWKSQVHARMKRVEGRDVAQLAVETVEMPQEWSDKLDDTVSLSSFYIANRETACILMLPKLLLKRAGTCTLALSLLLHAAHRIAMEGLPYRRRNFLRGHQVVLPEIAHNKQPQLTSIHGLLPTWQVVYKMAGSSALQLDQDLVLGDLEWESVEMKLARLIPEIGFWIDTHYLAHMADDEVQSLHIVDVASDLAMQKRGSKAHFEASLWNELQLRYLQEEIFEQALLRQLQSNEELVVY